MILKHVSTSLEEFIFTGLPEELPVSHCKFLRHVTLRSIFFFFTVDGEKNTENFLLKINITHKLWHLFNEHSI